MYTPTPKKNDNVQSGKLPTRSMGHGWTRPGMGRGGKHQDHNRYDRKVGKAVPRD